MKQLIIILDMKPKSREMHQVFDKRRIIAKRGFNRWVVPPVALVVRLCIGMAYGVSVF